MQKVVRHVWQRYSRRYTAASEARPFHIGCYSLIPSDGATPVRTVIDTVDSKELIDERALEWSDIYFKTNLWTGLDYQRKVHPLFNGNGNLSEQDLRFIETLRCSERNIDFLYWATIWEPHRRPPISKEAAHALLEHQIRLFESLANVRGSISLLAVFRKYPAYDGAKDYLDRLTAAGVEWQIGWGKIDSETLWHTEAASRLVFLRPGDQLCISWRLTDLLCMGAAVMLDGVPLPRIHVPFTPGVHYLDGGCRLDADYALPPDTAYRDLPKRIENAVQDSDTLSGLRKNAADLFDAHLNPVSLMRYVLSTTSRYTGSTDQSVPNAKVNKLQGWLG